MSGVGESLPSSLVGVRFTRLVVISPAEPRASRRRWLCKCDCGTVRDVAERELTGNKTKSCGCLKREAMVRRSSKHGQGRRGERTAEYAAWKSMKTRCYNPNFKDYAIYGGRGITVCPEWRDSFETFFADMGMRPPGHSLDRIEHDGNYEPGNCRWATQKAQCRNLRKNVIVTYMGHDLVLSELAEMLRLDYNSLRYLCVQKGLPVEKAVGLAKPKRRIR